MSILWVIQQIFLTMKNEIFINYPDADSNPIKVSYTVSQDSNLHVIECAVDTKESNPTWLQSTRFHFTSLKRNNHFSLLFEELKYNKNLETFKFMNKCYAKIMSSAKLSFDY